MKDRPIIFGAPMVRALLNGTKTQTRRVARLDDPYNGATWVRDGDTWTPCRDELCRGTLDAIGPGIRCPYGVPGDRLWVRETWQGGVMVGDTLRRWVRYAADDPKDLPEGTRWRSPRFMPRWASRITTVLTEVRLERVQSIEPEDARAEGIVVPRCSCETCSKTSLICPADGGAYVQDFATLWDSINGKRDPWSSNPFVWCLTLKRVIP